MIRDFQGSKPTLEGERIFIAPTAVVIGRVHLAEDVSVWFNTTIRGDVDSIKIGKGSNVQDGSTLHTDAGIPLVIGEYVTIGHNCVIHGCTIDDSTIIGMGSIILNGAVIGKNCLVGAGSLVTGKLNAADGMMILGSPAKVIRPLTKEELAHTYENAAHYVQNKDLYL